MTYITKMKLQIVGTAALLAMPLSAQADADQIDTLFDALQLSDITQIMREEGVSNSAQIAEEMFPNRNDAGWDATVDAIYNIDWMEAKVRADFANSLGDNDLAPILEFFQSQPGATFVSLEVSARRAMLDDAVEEASDDAALIAQRDRTERFQQLETFIEVSDLVEPNVVAALNSNYAFYSGLADGDFFGAEMSEDQLLADVWSQEADIRSNTTEWLFSFLLTAYAPMSDDDLASYIAFSESEAGRVVNDALFDAFADMFDTISYRLGRAAADVASQQEL